MIDTSYFIFDWLFYYGDKYRHKGSGDTSVFN